MVDEDASLSPTQEQALTQSARELGDALVLVREYEELFLKLYDKAERMERQISMIKLALKER